MVSGGAVSHETGMVIGISIVLGYTIFGGMWSVALLDFVQMTVIMVALVLIAFLISGETGGGGAVVSQAQAAGKLKFFPEGSGMEAWVPFIGTGITMMLGSIPQQDVFQRMTSAKTEKIAVRGSVLGGVLYFCFAFIPMFLAYSATLIDPALFNKLIAEDSQMVLPQLILNHTPLIAQVLFFGALLSAIMSTASATLLAPSVMFTENILKHFALKHMSDQQLLRTMRIILVTFGGFVLWFAMNSESTIFGMVEDAYKVTLVGAFVPLAFGLYWKRASNQGALLSIVLGVGAWLSMEYFKPETYWPPQLIGLLFSISGMLIGSTLPNLMRDRHHARIEN